VKPDRQDKRSEQASVYNSEGGGSNRRRQALKRITVFEGRREGLQRGDIKGWKRRKRGGVQYQYDDGGDKKKLLKQTKMGEGKQRAAEKGSLFQKKNSHN